MKIAIVGAGGQLGVDCNHVLAEESEVYCCDMPKIDITQLESSEKILGRINPEVIINCAAYTAVDGCESDLELSWKVNAEGAGNLAQIAARLGSRLVHISTDYVFDGRRLPPSPYLETDSTNPLSQYGRSKLAGEQLVKKNCRNSLILRTAWLYSANGPNFLKTMLRLAVNNPGKEIKVVNDQFGSLTWSHTLARQIKRLLATDLVGIVHTTAEGYSSWYEAAVYFLEQMEVAHSLRPCTTEEYPTAACRPANSILENRVLKERNLSEFVDWREDLKTFVQRHRQQLLDEL